MKRASGFRLRLIGGVMLSVLAAVPAFSQPSSRTSARLAFDPQIGRPVLFGGLTPLFVRGDQRNARDHLSETWEWTGRRWVQRYYENTPPPRAAFAMVTDTVNERILVFGGGTTDDAVLNDTWALQRGVWSRIETPAAPPARRLMGAAFDRQSGRMIIFGGSDGSTTLRDTWEFDGQTWVQTGSNGPEVFNPTLVYDAARGETLMMGMATDGATLMYRYTGSGWNRIEPAKLPECVNLTTMAFQEHNQKVLLAGGGCINGNALGKTWEWDGETWTELTVTGTIGGVVGHAMTYDPARSETLLFGGSEFGFDRNDTLRYRDGRWLRAPSSSTPGGRSLMVFETDPESGTIWMFGGLNALGDLWRYRFGNWERVVAPNQPSTCIFPAGTWDSDRDRLVIVCNDSSVHEWDGAEWKSFSNLDRKPPIAQWRMFEYDPKLKRSVLYGGGISQSSYYSNETWTWNGSTWTKVDSRKHPGYRGLSMMFFDETRQQIVLYGGIGRIDREGRLVRFADTWTFDGKDWVELPNVSSPPARYGALLGRDPETGLVHMFGGKDENEEFIDEHYTWDGTRWTLVAADTEPLSRQNGGLAWDYSLGHLTMFGGYAGYYLSDLWKLTEEGWRPIAEEGTRRRPAGRAPADDTTAGAGETAETEVVPAPSRRRAIARPE